MTTHSRSGRFFDFCLPLEGTPSAPGAGGSRLLLLKCFLLLLRDTPVSLCNFSGLAGGVGFIVWVLSVLVGVSCTTMTGSSDEAFSEATSLSLLPLPVNRDSVMDRRFSPLSLLGRLLLPDNQAFELRLDADKKLDLCSSGVGGGRPRTRFDGLAS